MDHLRCEIFSMNLNDLFEKMSAIPFPRSVNKSENKLSSIAAENKASYF